MTVDRRTFLAHATAAVAASTLPSIDVAFADAVNGETHDSAALAPATSAMSPLALGAVRPSGWLLRQMRIQADGLSGHLDQFWPDVSESQWFGGPAEGWERAPYWLDGAIPLAWLLDDAPMKARITSHVNFIITHQRDDGWLARIR